MGKVRNMKGFNENLKRQVSTMAELLPKVVVSQSFGGSVTHEEAKAYLLDGANTMPITVQIPKALVTMMATFVLDTAREHSPFGTIEDFVQSIVLSEFLKDEPDTSMQEKISIALTKHVQDCIEAKRRSN